MIVLPAKTVYMIRHGETVANAEGWVAGSIDTPLTEKGRSEPTVLRHYLETLSNIPKLIIYTPLSRSKDTAVILNENLNLPMMECASMTERCFGDWQGIPLETMRERRDAGLEPPNGEISEVFEKRVINGLEEILKLPDEPVLIVTHGGVFGALTGYYKCKIELVKNCHLYEFVPSTEKSPFPWKIWSHQVSEEGSASRMPVEIAEAPKASSSDRIALFSKPQQTSFCL